MDRQIRFRSVVLALAAMLLAVTPMAGLVRASAAHARAAHSDIQEPSSNPIESVKALDDAINHADFSKALATFADDAVVSNPLGVFVGKAEIGTWLEAAVKTDRIAPQTFEMKGPFVVSTGAVALDRFTKAGVPYVSFRAEYLVDKNGKIRFFAPVPLPTPEQAAKLQPPSLPPAKIDPTKVAQAYVKAVNSGNFRAAAAMFAPDSAALVYGGLGFFSGKPQIDAFHMADVRLTRAKSETWEQRGNTVINTGLGSFERLRKLGMDWVPYRTEYIIENGKIRFFRGALLLTPEQQAKLAAASVAPTR